MSQVIREYLREKLKADGYEGVSCPDEPCGCDLDDLAPCGGDPLDCVPAYKTVCTGEECPHWGGCGDTGAACYVKDKPVVAR